MLGHPAELGVEVLHPLPVGAAHQLLGDTRLELLSGALVLELRLGESSGRDGLRRGDLGGGLAWDGLALPWSRLATLELQLPLDHDRRPRGHLTVSSRHLPTPMYSSELGARGPLNFSALRSEKLLGCTLLTTEFTKKQLLRALKCTLSPKLHFYTLATLRRWIDM